MVVHNHPVNPLRVCEYKQQICSLSRNCIFHGIFATLRPLPEEMGVNEELCPKYLLGLRILFREHLRGLWFLCDTWHVNTLTAQALPQDIQNVTLLVQLGMQSSLSDLCQHPALPRAPLSTQVARALCVRHFEHSLERGWLSLCLHRALSCKTDRRFNCLNLRSLFLLFFFFFFSLLQEVKKDLAVIYVKECPAYIFP